MIIFILNLIFAFTLCIVNSIENINITFKK
jgi:hypothetical protein